MLTGAANPRGSKRLLMVDNTPRLVNGLSLAVTGCHLRGILSEVEVLKSFGEVFSGESLHDV